MRSRLIENRACTTGMETYFHGDLADRDAIEFAADLLFFMAG